MKRAILTLISIVGLTSMANSGNYYKQLKRELLVIWNEDQDIRNEYLKAREKLGESDPKVENIAKVMRYKDSIHLVKVSKILDEEGWIGKDKIGQLANNTLFLVIQHSDLKTQQKYLPMMRNAVKEGKTELSWLVLLEDRVALREGRKQIYGSHVFGNKETKKIMLLHLTTRTM
jgi:transcription initiation factor TFIID subunit TAF12